MRRRRAVLGGRRAVTLRRGTLRRRRLAIPLRVLRRVTLRGGRLTVTLRGVSLGDLGLRGRSGWRAAALRERLRKGRVGVERLPLGLPDGTDVGLNDLSALDHRDDLSFGKRPLGRAGTIQVKHPLLRGRAKRPAKLVDYGIPWGRGGASG